MPTIKELRHRRGEIEHQMRALVDAAEKDGTGRDFTAEENSQFEKLHEEDVGLRSRIERAEKVERIASENAETRAGVHRRSEFPPASAVGDEPDEDDVRSERKKGVSEDVRCLLFSAWVRRQSGVQLTREMRRACKAHRFDPSIRSYDAAIHRTQDFRRVQREFLSRHYSRLDDMETRALTTAGGSAGSLVPQGFVNQLEVAMLTHGPMLQTSEVLVTEKGNDLSWPVADDTTNEGAIVGQGSEIADDEDPNFDAPKLAAFKFTSKIIKVAVEVIEDSEFEIPGLMGQMEGERIGRRMNRAFTVGAGTVEPLGIVTAAPVGVTAAADNALASDELFDLFHSVESAYRDDPSAAFMMNDAITLVIRKMKHDGNYIWRSGLEEGVPDRLLGKPVRTNNHMWDSVSIGKKVLLFGALNRYKVRLVRAIRQKRLVERYAEFDQEGFVANARADGLLLDAGTGPVKALQMASASG